MSDRNPWPRRRRGRQLFRRQLPAVLDLDGRRPWRRCARGAGQRRRRGVPLGLYLHIPFCRKRCHFCYFRVYTNKNAPRSSAISICSRASGICCAPQPRDRRPADRLRLLRRRHAVVPVDAAAASRWSSRLTAETPWTNAEGDHVRVRAGHADRGQARRDPRARRDAAEPGRRELRRRILELNGRAHRSPEIDRAYAQARGARLSADQHRSDRRHARRDRRQLAALHRAHAGARAGQRDHLPDGAAVQHDDQRRHPEGRRPVQRARRAVGDAPPLGARGVRGARARRLHHRQRLHRGEGSVAHEVRVSRSALAGRRSRRHRRRVVRPRQRRAHAESRSVGEPTKPRSIAANCRSAAPTGRPTTSG